MLAHHVEAQAFHGFHVVAQGFITGGGVEPIRPEALVQRAVLENGFVIEHEAHDALGVLIHAELAHGKIAVHPVEHLLLIQQADFQLIEVRGVGRPQFGMGDVEGDLTPGGSCASGDILSVEAGDSLDQHAAGGAIHQGEDLDETVIDIGGDAQGFDVDTRHRLEPDGLPDAGGGGVEDGVAVEGLLAVFLPVGVGRVPHSHHQGVLAVQFYVGGNIDGEGGVSALVTAGGLVVDPHGGLPVHGVKVEQDAPVLPGFGYVEGAPVPQALGGQERFFDAGEGGFHGVGDEDATVVFIDPGLAAGGDGVLPQPVEALPVGAGHLRAGVFGPGVLGVDRFSPAGEQFAGHRLPLRFGFGHVNVSLRRVIIWLMISIIGDWGNYGKGVVGGRNGWTRDENLGADTWVSPYKIF